MKYFNKLLLAVALLVSVAVQAQDRYLDPVFNEVTVTVTSPTGSMPPFCMPLW